MKTETIITVSWVIEIIILAVIISWEADMAWG